MAGLGTLSGHHASSDIERLMAIRITPRRLRVAAAVLAVIFVATTIAKLVRFHAHHHTWSTLHSDHKELEAAVLRQQATTAASDPSGHDVESGHVPLHPDDDGFHSDHAPLAKPARVLIPPVSSVGRHADWDRHLPRENTTKDWCPRTDAMASFLRRVFERTLRPADCKRSERIGTKFPGGPDAERGTPGGKIVCVDDLPCLDDPQHGNSLLLDETGQQYGEVVRVSPRARLWDRVWQGLGGAPRPGGIGDCVVYSLGRWHFTFERDVVAQFGCEVHTFDCTVGTPPPEKIPPGVTFHRWCLSHADGVRPDTRTHIDFGASNNNASYFTFATIAEKLGHGPGTDRDGTIDLLKVEVERHEYEVLASLPDASLFRPRQVRCPIDREKSAFRPFACDLEA